MQSTQEIVELILDSNRNALLALDLKVSIVTMGFGAGALGVGAFGMNVCIIEVLRRFSAHLFVRIQTVAELYGEQLHRFLCCDWFSSCANRYNGLGLVGWLTGC